MTVHILPPIARLARAVSMLMLMALGVSVVIVPPSGASAASRGIEFVELDWPFPETDRSFVGAIHHKKRRMYAFGKEGTFDQHYNIAEYDLSTPVPKLLRTAEPGVTEAGLFSPYRVVIDEARDRMFVIETRSSAGRSLIEVIDLDTLERIETWDVTRTVPGFLTTGFTYDEDSDRLYLVGDFSASVNTRAAYALGGTKPVGSGSAVVAVDAVDGAFIWASLMPECDTPLDAATTGALIARSVHHPSLYTFCMGGPAAHQPSGQNGLVRMDISGQEATRGITQFPTEFFPISGTYAELNNTGVAAFDPAHERFFAQSLAARTPGTWVFDGFRDSWVGFIAAPDSNNLFQGLNPTNGRYYMGGDGGFGVPGYLNVTDGRSTPVAQGELFEDIPINGAITVDPATGRLFAPLQVPKGDGVRSGIMMLRDTTESIVPLAPVDFDQLTRDLPDGRALLQFSSGASGFGAKYLAIGGWESVYDRTTVPFFNNIVKPFIGANPTDLAYGDRGVTLAAAPSVDIRPAGASATAAATAVDQATESDRTDVETELGGAPDTPVKLLAGGLTCLDGGGEPIDRRSGDGDPERVHVRCDLERSTAAGAASFANDMRGGGQSLASATFDTRSFRDPKRGVVTETKAVAEGISLGEPGGGGAVSIDRVTATATTAADGRPGTSAATWERTVDGVVVEDRDGNAQRFGSCTTTVVSGAEPEHSGDCAAVQRALSDVSPRLQVRFPLPTVTATPRGAFARVEERETDYFNGLTTNNDQSRAVPAMEVMLYNDGPEKGRLLVQLAAIDANSIFTRSALPTFPDFDVPGTGTTTGAGSAQPVGGSTSTTTAVDAGPAPAADHAAGGGTGGDLATATAVQTESVAALAADEGVLGSMPEPVRTIVGWLVGRRSARDAAMSGGVWLLFFSALYGVWRRRRLIETVGG